MNPKSQNLSLAKAADTAVEKPLTDEQIAILESEGLGPRDIIREVKSLLTADPSKVIEWWEEMSLPQADKPPASDRRKLLPKHAKAIVEISGSKVRFIDRVAALKLAAEMAKLIGKASQKEDTSAAANMNFKQAVFLMPGAQPPAGYLPPAVPEEGL